MELKQLKIRVPVELHEAVKAKADSKGMSVNEVLTGVLKLWTEDKLVPSTSKVEPQVEEQSEPKLDTENLPSWSQVQEPEWVHKQEELEKKVQSEYDVKLTGEKADILSEFFSSRD